MGENSYKVVVSPRSMQMLSEHVAFLAKVNKSAAVKTKKTLIDALRSLSRMPHRFPFLSSPYLPVNKYHKMYVAKWYLVLYQIRDDVVFVDYILDCRKDYQWLIP